MLHEILFELLTSVIDPPPVNPFAIDHAQLEALPLEEALVATAALIDWLGRIYGALLRTEDVDLAERILADIGLLSERMWGDVGEVAAELARADAAQ